MLPYRDTPREMSSVGSGHLPQRPPTPSELAGRGQSYLQGFPKGQSTSPSSAFFTDLGMGGNIKNDTGRKNGLVDRVLNQNSGTDFCVTLGKSLKILCALVPCLQNGGNALP